MSIVCDSEPIMDVNLTHNLLFFRENNACYYAFDILLKDIFWGAFYSIWENICVIDYMILSDTIWAKTWKKKLLTYATSEDSDTPAHSHSLIRVFAVRMKKLCNFEYSKKRLVSFRFESFLSAWETLHPWLFKSYPIKIMTRMLECAGWSESSLDVHDWRYVFSRGGSFVFFDFCALFSNTYCILLRSKWIWPMQFL